MLEQFLQPLPVPSPLADEIQSGLGRTGGAATQLCAPFSSREGGGRAACSPSNGSEVTSHPLRGLAGPLLVTHGPAAPIPASPGDPATSYAARPKAAAGGRNTDIHDRLRADRIDADGKLYHIGIGRTHARPRVLMLVHDLDIRVIKAATGELLRQLTVDPDRNYQPTGPPPGTRRKQKNPEP